MKISNNYNINLKIQGNAEDPIIVNSSANPLIFLILQDLKQNYFKNNIILIAPQSCNSFMNLQQTKKDQLEGMQPHQYEQIDYLLSKYEIIDKTLEGYSETDSFNILIQTQMMELKLKTKQRSEAGQSSEQNKEEAQLNQKQIGLTQIQKQTKYSQKTKSQFLKKLLFYSQIYVYDENKNKKKTGYIWDRFISIGDKKLSIHQIIKLKCLKDQFVGSYKLLKLVDTSQNSYLFFANSKKKSPDSKLRDHYLWFAKIMSAKLQSMKYFVKVRKPLGGSLDFVPKSKLQQSIIEGYIYKRSKYLQEWKKRYIIITKSSLYSYKEYQNQCSFSVKSEQIKQMWTRFDIYEGYVVIKLKHSYLKSQFAIPIVDFSSRTSDGWIKAFYQLMIP